MFTAFHPKNLILVQKTPKSKEDTMAAGKEIKETKTKKLADPVAATIDPASQQMIERAHELGIETAFDRAVTMKPLRLKIRASSWKSRNGWGSTQQLKLMETSWIGTSMKLP